MRCEEREKLIQYLDALGISANKHYPIPIHLQEAYAELNIAQKALPIAEEISRTECSLPMYYGMTEEEISYVIQKLNAFA